VLAYLVSKFSLNGGFIPTVPFDDLFSFPVILRPKVKVSRSRIEFGRVDSCRSSEIVIKKISK
jgi:hypothetical protein